jgi:hypothetical protein
MPGSASGLPLPPLRSPASRIRRSSGQGASSLLQRQARTRALDANQKTRLVRKYRTERQRRNHVPDLFFRLVRSRGLEPPRVAPLAPQASASTNSATTAWGKDVKIRKPRVPMMADHVTNRMLRDKARTHQARA